MFSKQQFRLCLVLPMLLAGINIQAQIKPLKAPPEKVKPLQKDPKKAATTYSILPVAPVKPGLAAAVSNSPWADTAKNYEGEFTAKVMVGDDGLRYDSDVKMNLILPNGMLIELYKKHGYVMVGNPPNRLTHYTFKSKKQQFITSLQGASVELVHFRKPLNTDERSRPVDELEYNNADPDKWNFEGIEITGKITYTHPVTKEQQVVAQGDVFHKVVHQIISYGYWENYIGPAIEIPAEILRLKGYIYAPALAAGDGCKMYPAENFILLKAGGNIYNWGNMIQKIGAYHIINEYSYLPGLQVKWNDITNVGFRYKYGDHGAFDRDDFSIRGVAVNFRPWVSRGADSVYNELFFRKFQFYKPDVLVKLNGDGEGEKFWSPF